MPISISHRQAHINPLIDGMIVSDSCVCVWVSGNAPASLPVAVHIHIYTYCCLLARTHTHIHTLIHAQVVTAITGPDLVSLSHCSIDNCRVMS